MHVAGWATLSLLASCLPSGCSSESSAEQFTLAETTWQLVSIQSMDDAQGTTRVADPSTFTVTFDGTGQASFQIDCNRGSGTYEAQPGLDQASGLLTFGPIATTMMMCPQPSLDQRVSTALSYVRTYLFQDGQLHMSLEADSGILDWQRA